MNSKFKTILPWIDVLAFFAWGALFLKYWYTGQIKLLIHPNYFWLTVVTGIGLLIIAGAKAWHQIKRFGKKKSEKVQHLTLFPPGWSSSLLLGTAILGFLIAPGVLASQTALQRGITDTLPITRAQPQSFRTSIKPEERSLIEWVRTLNAYPEPDAYNAQKAKVKGFVVYPPTLPNNYIFVTRFVLTCCAVDAYPVALPVKLNQSRQAYPQDTWIEVEGETITETLPVENTNMEQTTIKNRQLVIAANTIKKFLPHQIPMNIKRNAILLHL